MAWLSPSARSVEQEAAHGPPSVREEVARACGSAPDYDGVPENTATSSFGDEWCDSPGLDEVKPSGRVGLGSVLEKLVELFGLEDDRELLCAVGLHLLLPGGKAGAVGGGVRGVGVQLLHVHCEDAHPGEFVGG